MAARDEAAAARRARRIRLARARAGDRQAARGNRGSRVEFAAVAQAPDDADARARLEDEIGDLLFVCANLARHAKVDPGNALRHANAKFERRFRAMEALAATDGIELAALALDAQDRYWDRAKLDEKKPEAP
jgi:ATP diphosphatase